MYHEALKERLGEMWLNEEFGERWRILYQITDRYFDLSAAFDDEPPESLIEQLGDYSDL